MSDKKSSASSVFLFYGEDSYSCHQKLKFWKDEFIKKYGEDSLEVFEGKNLSVQQFGTNIEALPFLSEKRLLIIKDFLATAKEEDQKAIAKSLSKTPDFSIVIFHENSMPDKRTTLFKTINKIGKIEYFPGMSPQEISKWISDKAKKENIKISFGNAAYLSQQCGPDLWNIANEIDKLKLYSENREITSQMIDEICTPSLTSSIFKLTDEIAQKNTKGSLRTMKILIESGEDPIKIFFMIVRHFRILIQIHEMLSKGENSFSITKKLKQHPFVIQKTSGQCKNFSREKIEHIYESLLKIDTDFKTGVIKSYQGDNREFELAIEKLIIDCCHSA